MLNKKIHTIIVLLLAVVGVYAQETALAKPWTYKPVSHQTVTSTLNNLNRLIISGTANGKPISGLGISSYSSIVGLWEKRQWIEVETEIDKSWYKKVISIINYLGNCKKYLEISKYNKTLDDPKSRKVMQNYTAALKKFKEMIDNPTKVDRSKLSTLKRQRRDWLKMMRKKEKERLEKERYEKRRAR